MSYSWVPNIVCEIREGKAYLKNELKNATQCSGTCHSCSAFLGVDLKDTGKKYYQSCCDTTRVRPRSERIVL
jgi:hypothetical protein